jgi:hypothetical protein
MLHGRRGLTQKTTNYILEINFCEGLRRIVYSNIHTDEELHSETKAIFGINNVKMSAV